MSQFEITWQAPEFEYRDKSILWYWGTILAAVLILGVAIWQKSFLFGSFVVVAEVLILFWGNKQPRMVEFKMTEKGLTVSGGKFYSYADMKSFAVDDDPDSYWKVFFFDFKKKLKLNLRIMAPAEKLHQIRETIKSVVPLVEMEHSLIDTLERIFHF